MSSPARWSRASVSESRRSPASAIDTSIDSLCTSSPTKVLAFSTVCPLQSAYAPVGPHTSQRNPRRLEGQATGLTMRSHTVQVTVSPSVPSERERRQIHLVRHGPSAHIHTGWIDAQGFRAWRQKYEAAGVRDGQQPPERVVNLLRHAGIVVASDTLRARESASLLAPGMHVSTSPLLRELELRGPSLGPLRLPLFMWAIAVGSRTGALRLIGRYPGPAEEARVAEAANWLSQLSETRGSVVAVTHASFRKLVSRRLRASAWRCEGSARSLRPWSVWSHLKAGESPDA